MQNYVDPSKLSSSSVDFEQNRGSKPIDFDQLLAAARRQSRIVFAAATISLIAGVAYVVTAVPLYTATANLLIDSQKDKNVLATSIADLTFDTGAIDSQVEVLKSDKIALAVVAAQKLASDPEFMGARGTLIGQAVGLVSNMVKASGWLGGRELSQSETQQSFELEAVAQLKAHLDVRRVARTYVLAISYTSPDRFKAAAISNAFAEAYINEQLEAKFEATRRAAGWMQTRISDLKQQSIESDMAIQKFKALHGIVVTGGDRPGLMSDQQLTELNTQMITAQGETARAEARYKQIEELLRSGRTGIAVPDSLSNPVVNELRAKYLAASKSEAQLESKLGNNHIQVIQLKREMAEYERLILEELQRIAQSYRSDAEVARAKDQALASSMSSLVGQSAVTNQTLVQLRELERESETYRSLYQSFMQRYQEALQRQSSPETEARVITDATPPQTPSFPKKPLVLALSLVLGLMVGGGVGALREYRDRVFRVASHVRDELGLEFLGLLQAVNSRASVRVEDRQAIGPSNVKVSSAIQRYTLDHPLSSFSETLRTAKVAVDLALRDRRPKIVGIISILPNEGKSTVAKNFTSLLAHLGAKTLLIDADLRNPGLSKSIARHAEGGLLEALRRERPPGDFLLSEPDSGLYFLPTVVKKRVIHSSEIVASTPMKLLLAEAAQSFEYIVLDLPPLGPVVDVRAASSMFDAFIFVAEWGRTPRAIVQNLLAGDESLYEKCVGVVYNKVNLKRVKLYESYGSRDYYYGRYSKYYHVGKA